MNTLSLTLDNETHYPIVWNNGHWLFKINKINDFKSNRLILDDAFYEMNAEEAGIELDAGKHTIIILYG